MANNTSDRRGLEFLVFMFVMIFIGLPLFLLMWSDGTFSVEEKRENVVSWFEEEKGVTLVEGNIEVKTTEQSNKVDGRDKRYAEVLVEKKLYRVYFDENEVKNVMIMGEEIMDKEEEGEKVG